MADPVSLAITVALNVASMALTAMNRIEGPRLDDLSVSTADYGTPMIQFYGTRRLECFCFYAEPIREEKQTNKSKGGKYTEYKYYGTWANFVADHEISAVLSVWLDRHLVYDRTGTSGPVTRILDVPFLKLGASRNFRVYLGTESQQPDRRMVAKIEEREGAGMCPAYLGIAYMMFEEIPLEKFGNRLPQVSARATRATTPKYPLEVHATALGGSTSARITFGGSWAVIANSAGILEWWYVPTRTKIAVTPSPGFPTGSVASVALGPDGTAYYMGTIIGFPSVKYLAICKPAGSPALAASDAISVLFYRTRYLSGTVYTSYSVSDGYVEDATHIPAALPARDFCEDDDGNVYILYQAGGASDSYTLAGNGQNITWSGNVVRSSVTAAQITFLDGKFFISGGDGYFYIVDQDTEAVTSGVATWTNNVVFQQGAETFFDQLGGTEYSFTDGSVVSTLDKDNYGLATLGQKLTYDAINDALWDIITGDLNILYLNRVDGQGWTLGDICEDVALQCGMKLGDYDFTNLDQNVPGFSWTQGPGKEIVGPLLELWDSDIRPHGWIQQGLKRGQPLAGETISSEWMVPESGNPLYEIPMTAETELPRRIVATFADPAMEEQPNTAIAQRNASSVETKREQAYDLTTLQIPADDIQPLLERSLRRSWIGAAKPKGRLTPLEIRVEPGDVRHLLLGGERMRCKNTRARIRADRSIDSEWEVDGEVQVNIPPWELDDASPLDTIFYSPGAVTGGRPDEPVLTPMATKGEIIDTPLFSDVDDQTTPFLYDAAGPYGEGFWPGAMVFTADENEADTLFDAGWDSFSSDGGMTWGFVETELADALTDVFDEASQLDVRILNGTTLASVTEDELLADQSVNMALVGNELIQFRDVELIDTNEYRLTGLIRGVRGTEYATGDHAIGERFVLINAAIRKRTVGASEIGDTDYYKFSTTGDDLDFVETITLAYEARAHKPYSVAHLELWRDTGTNDWLITWQRRTRIGGSTLNGQDVPLGETSELYRVKIMDGADVVASYDVTDEQKLYTAAEQNTDWGSVQSSLSVIVVQVAPTLSLEGFEATASV